MLRAGHVHTLQTCLCGLTDVHWFFEAIAAYTRLLMMSRRNVSTGLHGLTGAGEGCCNV